MAEDLTLTTPITRPAVTAFRVTRLELQWGPDAHIGIHLVDPNGVRKTCGYNDSGAGGRPVNEATILMTALNKANLSVKSLHKRILERVAVDFPELAGSVTGTPD